MSAGAVVISAIHENRWFILTMSKLNILMSFMVCLILSGCNHFSARALNSTDSEALIAQDMVNVLMQIEELPAATTTLNIPLPHSAKDSFTATLIAKFKDAGYAVRTVGIDPGEAIVSYALKRDLHPQHGAVNTYTVSIGTISVRRAYVTTGNQRVRPLAAMQIKGASAAGLRLENQLFENQGPVAKPQNKVVAEHEVAVPEVSAQPPARAVADSQALLTPANVERRTRAPVMVQEPLSTDDPSLLNIVAPTTYKATGAGSESSALRELFNTPTRNVRELGQSNFAETFARLTIVGEVILIFDNDSVRMGAVNKMRVNELVRLFNDATDIFSVIGCSNGATSLAMGQEGLALGRAERVKEELLFAGVPGENILEEGCWAGEPYDERMPRRGVVLSLKRRSA